MLLPLSTPSGDFVTKISHDAMRFMGWHMNKSHEIIIHIQNPVKHLHDNVGDHVAANNTLYIEKSELMDYYRFQQMCGSLPVQDQLFYHNVISFFEPQEYYPKLALN